MCCQAAIFGAPAASSDVRPITQSLPSASGSDSDERPQIVELQQQPAQLPAMTSADVRSTPSANFGTVCWPTSLHCLSICSCSTCRRLGAWVIVLAEVVSCESVQVLFANSSVWTLTRNVLADAVLLESYVHTLLQLHVYGALTFARVHKQHANKEATDCPCLLANFAVALPRLCFQFCNAGGRCFAA